MISAANAPTSMPHGMPDPRRDAEVHQQQRHGVGAEAEEGGVPERDQARIAAQNVPRQSHHRPDRHQSQHELVVLVGDQQGAERIQHVNSAIARSAATMDRRLRMHAQVRSALRPYRPCGRSSTMSEEDDENSDVLQLKRHHQRRQLLHQADRHAAPESAQNAAHAAEHDTGVHDDDELEPDVGLERVIGGDQPARHRRDAGADAERDAMRAIDVDAHVDRGFRIVGGGAQRSCRAACGR